MAAVSLRCVVLLAVLSSRASLAQLPEDAPVRPVVCGSRFTDPSSSALLCDVVLQGEVTRVRQASPRAPLLYRASVTVQKVFKGQALLHQDSSFTDEGDAVEPIQVEIDKFGPEENGENCVGKVMPDNTYLFFLSPVSNNTAASSSQSSMLLVNTAMPRHMDMQVVKQVMQALCEGCPVAPVIKRVRCKHCAAEPVMQKEMGDSGSKMVQAGSKLALRCVAKGSPMPMYTWVKDGKVLHSSEYESTPSEAGGERDSASATAESNSVVKMGSVTIRHGKRYSTLVVKETSPEDGGTYRCLATNALGEAEQVVHVVVKGDIVRRPSPTTAQPSVSTAEPGSGKIMNFPDPCSLQPCYHGGSCSADDTGAGGFVCACPARYHGNKCQFIRHDTTVDENETLLQPDLRLAGERDNDDEDDDENNEKSSIGSLPQQNTVGELDNNNNVVENDNGVNSTNNRNDISNNEPSPNKETSDNDLSHTSRLEAKKRRKYEKSSSGRSESVEGKDGKSGVPQLKVAQCPDLSYCKNGGVCKVVVKIQRQFCECLPGFVGRHCEVAV